MAARSQGQTAAAVPTERAGLSAARVAELVGRSAVYLLIAVLFLGPFIWMFFGSIRKACSK